jgi:hypothetical protein
MKFSIRRFFTAGLHHITMPSANGHVPNTAALIPASTRPTKSLRKWGRIDTNYGQ